jgi:hypothetical protein
LIPQIDVCGVGEPSLNRFGDIEAFNGRADEYGRKRVRHGGLAHQGARRLSSQKSGANSSGDCRSLPYHADEIARREAGEQLRIDSETLILPRLDLERLRG